jgi:hypothetical protein
MLRGRHRGLPVAIDKAVLLPDETLAWAEEEDAQMRKEAGQGLSGGLRRRMTGLSQYEGQGVGNGVVDGVNGNGNGKVKGNGIGIGRSPERGGQGSDLGGMV